LSVIVLLINFIHDDKKMVWDPFFREKRVKKLQILVKGRNNVGVWVKMYNVFVFNLILIWVNEGSTRRIFTLCAISLTHKKMISVWCLFLSASVQKGFWFDKNISRTRRNGLNWKFYRIENWYWVLVKRCRCLID